jgi:glutaredoxin
MKRIALLICLLINLSVFSQKKNIEFQIKKGKNRITFKGINKSDFDQEVVLYFNSIQGLFGYSKPIKKIIPAKSKLEFVELRFNGKYSYNYSYRVKSKPTVQQKLDWEKKIASHDFKEGSNFKKGIIIFSKDGCSRCKMSIEYLIKNEVDFQIMNISDKEQYRSLMWKVIKDNGENLDKVPTPVILVNGKPHHSFKDLNKFLKKLKKMRS